MTAARACREPRTEPLACFDELMLCGVMCFMHGCLFSVHASRTYAHVQSFVIVRSVTVTLTPGIRITMILAQGSWLLIWLASMPRARTCQLCFRHRSCYRRLCVACRRFVGPGCLPERCLWVDIPGGPVPRGLCWPCAPRCIPAKIKLLARDLSHVWHLVSGFASVPSVLRSPSRSPIAMRSLSSGESADEVCNCGSCLPSWHEQGWVCPYFRI